MSTVVELLRRRREPPRVVNQDGVDRLLIVPGEGASGGVPGRPMDPSYWSVTHTLGYMARHEIDVTVLSQRPKHHE